MIKYPLFFEAETKSKSGAQAAFEAKADGYPPILCAIPQEFEGPGGGYSPEDLYCLALITCFIATFKKFAEKADLQYAEVAAKARLTLERNALGAPELKKVEVEVSLAGAPDQEKAKTLFNETEKLCLVANAIRSEKVFSYRFH